MMKRLLVFHPAIAPYRIDLFNVLNERFNAIFYFYKRNVTGQKFDQDALENQLNFRPAFLNFGVSLGYRDRVVRFGILPKILKHQPEVILCSEYSITTFLSIVYKKIFLPKSKVYSLCDDSLKIAEECSGLRSIARKLVLKLIDGLVLCNEPAKRWYDKNFPDVDTYIYPLIQDEARLKSLIPQLKEIIVKKGLDVPLKNNKTFLYVGRFSPEKNLEFLILAFAKHCGQCEYPSKLILVGEGEQKDKLLQLTEELNIKDRVLMPGRFEGNDLYAWYLVADYFILPSVYEPFGAVVNEALIFNLPVICSEIAGAASLINTTNGVLFNPLNEKELIAIFNTIHISKVADGSFLIYSFKKESDKFVSFLNN